MWILWWALSLAAGLIGLYLLVVIPLALLYSAWWPQRCPTCGERTLKYQKFRSTDPGDPGNTGFTPRAYYRYRQCHGEFKLQLGDWSAVELAEVGRMIGPV